MIFTVDGLIWKSSISAGVASCRELYVKLKEEKNVFGEMEEREGEQACGALTQAGFYWAGCDSSASPTL